MTSRAIYVCPKVTVTAESRDRTGENNDDREISMLLVRHWPAHIALLTGLITAAVVGPIPGESSASSAQTVVSCADTGAPIVRPDRLAPAQIT